MYLVKAQRTFGNHQYILGFCNDLDIAHFHGYQHGRYDRADKYTYTIEEIPWATDGESTLYSWETEGELCAYLVLELHEDYNTKKIEKTIKNNSFYRCRKQITKAMDYNISEDDLIHCCQHWWFYEGRVLVGLRKIYQYFRDNDNEEKDFWNKFYKSRTGEF